MKDNKALRHGSLCKENVLAGSIYCYALCPYFNGTNGNYNPMPDIYCSNVKVRPDRY